MKKKIYFFCMASNKIGYLDGLRGAACVVVVLFHWLSMFYPAAINGNLAQSHTLLDVALFHSPLFFLLSGRFAVAVFFVLSGFVLTRAYFIKGDLNILIKRALGRYIRLLIPVASAMVLAWVCLVLNLYIVKDVIPVTLVTDSGTDELLSRSFLYLLKSIFFLTWFGDPMDFEHMYLDVLWTMQTELKGSFLVLSSAIFINAIKYKQFVIAIMVGLCSRYIIPLGVFYADFLVGMLLASYPMKPLKNSLILIPFLLFALYLGGYQEHSNAYVLVAKIVGKFSAHLGGNEIICYAIASGILVYILLKSEFMQKFFDSPVFNYLGKISFSLYLLHIPVMRLVGDRVFAGLYQYNYHAAAIASLIVSIIIAITISTFATDKIDATSVRLSHQFSNKIINSP